MDMDGRVQGYEDRRARSQPGRILIPDLVAERLRSLQERPELPGRGGRDMEAARGMLSPAH